MKIPVFFLYTTDEDYMFLEKLETKINTSFHIVMKIRITEQSFYYPFWSYILVECHNNTYSISTPWSTHGIFCDNEDILSDLTHDDRNNDDMVHNEMCEILYSIAEDYFCPLKFISTH